LNNKPNPEQADQAPGSPDNLANEIMDLVSQKCKNPGEAFVLLQQLTVFVWDQYKIDWNQNTSATTRKSRYLDYVSELLDTLSTNKALGHQID
jgi:hypothetical protein